MGKKIDKQGTGIIYKRTSPSGKSYIGKTFLQEQERWKQHVSEANRGEKLTKLNKAIKKYGGENFSVEILESCLEEPELSEREKYYISYYTLEELKAHGNIASANKRKQPILQYSLDGVLLREWLSLSEAGRALQISIGHISAACKHQKGRPTAGGYRWEYKNGQEN